MATSTRVWTSLRSKALGTVDPRQREPILVDALKVMTDDAVVNPIILQPKSMAYRNGLVGPRETWVDEKALIWNIWEWRWQ